MLGVRYMSYSDPSVSNFPSQEVKQKETYTRLRGPWLVLARLGWGVFVVLTLGLFFLSMPGYYQRLRTFSNSVFDVPYVVRAGLAHLGLSANFLIDHPNLTWLVALEIFIWDVTVILLCLLLP